MASSKRYFVNKLNDFDGSDIKISSALLKKHCMEYIQKIFKQQTTTHDDCDGGLYVGLAGIAYMCYYASQSPDYQDHKSEFLGKGLDYLKHALAYVERPSIARNVSMQASFLLGTGGVYVAAAALLDAADKKTECKTYLQKYVALADICIPINFLKCGSDELLVGRAGYLCGLLFLLKKFGNQIAIDDKVTSVCNAIIESGVAYANRRNSPCPLMYAYYNTEYLGAAHGLCGILQMLLSFPTYLDKNPEAERKVKQCVDFFLGIQTSSGNFASAVDEINHSRTDELVHWCHGAPGVVYMMAKAYLRWKEDKYLQSCLLCGEIVWKKGLLKKGPGICHGVSGSGYVFLLLYRLTNDAQHLHRAVQFANFLFEDEFHSARTPDKPLSLYEGIAGTVCFLIDLLQPHTASFPFSDVF